MNDTVLRNLIATRSTHQLENILVDFKRFRNDKPCTASSKILEEVLYITQEVLENSNRLK